MTTNSINRCAFFVLFFFNDTATTEIYTLSLHDALPIFPAPYGCRRRGGRDRPLRGRAGWALPRASGSLRAKRSRDRKSTRLNSSHANISYAVFCLKKKKNTHYNHFYPHLSIKPQSQNIS